MTSVSFTKSDIGFLHRLSCICKPTYKSKYCRVLTEKKSSREYLRNDQNKLLSREDSRGRPVCGQYIIFLKTSFM